MHNSSNAGRSGTCLARLTTLERKFYPRRFVPRASLRAILWKKKNHLINKYCFSFYVFRNVLVMYAWYTLYWKVQIKQLILPSGKEKKVGGICQKYFLLRTFQTLSAFLTSLVPQETLPCDDRAAKKENGKWLLKTTQFALHVCTKCRPDGSSVTICTKNWFESNNLITS